jgi:RimJ/RimL family protein N-acetyltransferase
MPLSAVRALETPRLVLEPLGTDHAAPLFPGFSSRELFRYLDGEPPATAAALYERFARITREGAGAPDRWINWAARGRDGGYTGLVEVTLRPDRSANLAYFTFAPFARRGLAREGCAAVLAELCHTFGARTVVATMDVRNEPSWRLVASLRFLRDVATMPSSIRGEATTDYRYVLELRDDPGDA